MLKISLYLSSLILIVLLLPGQSLYAGNTGKIVGKVLDKQTNEPLVGANILIKESSLGASTDLEGFFYILQVPPGTYDLEFSYIGYHTLTVTNVKINVDLTTEVNANLESELIEAPTIVVVAEQELVTKDITSTRKISSGKELNDNPGIESTSDVFRLFSGAVVDQAPQAIQLNNGTQLQVRDESVKNIHIRGGRGGEILFMVDGMPVTHPLYGGRSVIDLNVNDVDQMELLTGAFNAEYGQAQSGVINITTRSGKDRFEGGIEYKTDHLGFIGESYNTDYFSLHFAGPELLTKRLFPSLGLEIPGKMSFFVSANGSLSDTEFMNERSRDKISYFGLELTERQDNSSNLNAKIDWNNQKGIKAAFSYHGSWNDWSRYEWPWVNNPNNMADYSRSNQSVNFKYTQTLSQNTFFNLSLGYLGVNYHASLNGKKPTDFWLFFKDSVDYADGNGYDYDTWNHSFDSDPYKFESTIEAPTLDPLTGFYNFKGFENLWRDDNTSSFTFRGDISSQILPEHLIKTGIEVQYHDISYVDIQDGGVSLSSYGRYLYSDGDEYPAPPGPYKEFGQNRWVFNAYPLIGGAYIQDKFEMESLILNAGLRFDWFMPGETVQDNQWKTQWETATGLKADWKTFRYKLSPRFGISFPISEKTVLFFSYGHFNQLPELQFYYRDPYTGSFTGNPHLDYEQTILYEFGFTHQLAKDWAIDIKSYAKDISEQVGTLTLPTYAESQVYLYDNRGYSRARGLEFELIKRYANFISGKINYNVQWANGYASSAFDDYIRSINNFPNPIRERRLGWDVRHQVVMQSTISSPKGKAINLFGVSLPDNWDITILSRYSSGQPYTPGTTDPAELQKLENTETGPPTYVTDIKVKKHFDLKFTKLSIFLDVFNLFDQKNVQIAYGFNNWKGNPYIYGDVFQDSYRGFSWYDIYLIMDPRQYAAGRYAKLGMSLDF